MPITKGKIKEEAKRIYARYVERENITPMILDGEMEIFVDQAINKILFTRTMRAQKINKVDIPQSSLVKYTVDVTSSKATLPAAPIDLEKDLGVWEIVDPANPLTAYIPLDKQKAKVFQGTIVENLENQVGFFRYGLEITFLKDPGVSQVDIWLIVSDLSQLSDTDVLPLAADQEFDVILGVMTLLGAGAFAQQELNSNNQMEKRIKEANDGNKDGR